MARGGSFREWLAARLAATVYATNPIADEDLDSVALKIGVQPELLREVRAGRGRTPVRDDGYIVSRSSHRRTLKTDLPMPEPVFAAWTEECAFRGVDGSVLLRSVIQAYLVAEREPTEILDHWIWRGVPYHMGRKERRTWLYQKTSVTIGAWRALKLRSDRLGVRRTSIMRALAVEILAGEHRTVRLIQTGQMFDDERRYYVG